MILGGGLELMESQNHRNLLPFVHLAHPFVCGGVDHDRIGGCLHGTCIPSFFGDCFAEFIARYNEFGTRHPVST